VISLKFRKIQPQIITVYRSIFKSFFHGEAPKTIFLIPMNPKLLKRVCLFLARQPPVGQGLLIHEVSRSHTTTHHSRYDSSERVINSSQRPLYLSTHNTQNRQISMPPAGFEPTISAGGRP